MQPQADTITIVEHQTQEMKSTGADIRCAISLIGKLTGTPEVVTALRKALIDGGHATDCLSVESMTHSNEGTAFGCMTAAVVGVCAFAFSKGARMDYVVPAAVIGGAIIAGIFWWTNRTTSCAFRITCKDSEAVSRTHAKLGENSKFQVTSTDWRYEIDSSTFTNWAEKCIQRANVRAEKVAAALGVKLDGVHSYEEDQELPRNYHTPEVSSGLNSIEAKRSARTSMSVPGPSNYGDFESLPTGSEKASARILIRYRIKKA